MATMDYSFTSFDESEKEHFDIEAMKKTNEETVEYECKQVSYKEGIKKAVKILKKAKRKI